MTDIEIAQAHTPKKITEIAAAAGIVAGDADRELQVISSVPASAHADIKAYMDRAVEQATESGYVVTMFGRRRTLHDIASANRTVRGIAERNAINTPIQGSAADIMKLAMIEIHRRFKAEGLSSKMIMQVHDEVVIDTLRDELQSVERIVSEAMQSVAKLKVPLLAEVNHADNWLEAH